MHTDAPHPEPAQAILERLGASPAPRAAWHAVDQLARLGAPAVPALAEALASPSVPLRRVAVQALERIGPAARAAARPLVERLFDLDAGVRADAAWALARIAPRLRGALPLLIGRLAAEADPSTMRGLLRVIGHVGPAAEGALPLIRAKLDDPRLFPDALQAWRAIRPHDPRLLDALRAQLRTDAPFRSLAATSIGKLRLDGPAWTRALDALARSADPRTQHAAREALGRLRA